MRIPLSLALLLCVASLRSTDWYLQSTRDISRRKWSDFYHGNIDEAVARIAGQREPLILLESPVAAWPALERWTDTYLSEHVPEVTGVYQLKKPLFVYNEETLPITASAFHQHMPRRTTRMLTSQFLTTLDNSTSPASRDTEWPYQYYSRPFLPRTEAQKTLEDPSIPAKVDFAPVYGDTTIARSSNGSSTTPASSHGFRVADHGRPHFTHDPQLWAGGGGVVTSPHYDLFHNFYAQVVGSKRFTLISPIHQRSMYLYPLAHIHSRQSQIDILARKKKRKLMKNSGMPLLGSSEAITFTLRAGELLYLPPFVFHQVEAVEKSISINYFSNSREADLSIAVSMHPLPPVFSDKDVHRRTVVSALASLLRTLTRTVDSLLPLFSPSERPLPDLVSTTFISEFIVLPRFAPLFTVLGCVDFDAHRCPSDGTVAPTVRESIDVWSLAVSSEFVSLTNNTKAADASHSLGVRQLLLANILDDVVNLVLGPQQSCPFLRCLAEPTAWASHNTQNL